MNAPKIAVAYGIISIILGIVGWKMTGGNTALIGSAFGLVGVMCGMIAMAKESLRKHIMHVFCLIVLVGALGPTVRFFISFGVDGKQTVLVFLGANALLSWGTLGLMIKSFIDARRARNGSSG
jgi:hypothetical protein